MNRREMLQAISVAPMAAAPLVSAEAKRIKATGIETFIVKVPRRNWVIVRLGTDAGVTGIGDASHGGADEEVVGFLRDFFERLKARSLHDIEWLRQSVDPDISRAGRAAAVAFSALEQCIWDIFGKVSAVPAYQFFGGRLHSKIRNYANINRATTDRTPEGFAQMAQRAVQDGFDAVKLAPFDGMPRDPSDPRHQERTELGIECARAVREIIGSNRDLLIDAHSHFNRENGLQLARRLQPLNLYWLEEVVRRNLLEDSAAINRAARMPTAGGEAIYSARGFYPYLASAAFDILMPDLKYCGGMLELKKIAAMAEAAGVPVAPHGPASPVGNVAAAHVCVGLPNFQILEYAYGEVPWRAELVDPPETIENGYLTLSHRPGLGITLNERTVKRHRVAGCAD